MAIDPVLVPMAHETIADLLAFPGMVKLPHPHAPEVELHVLAERHPSGTGITFVAYADLGGDEESRVAELTGLTADCSILAAIGMLESARGSASSWPTLTATLDGGA
jgi:hypothetical protein